MLVSFAKNVHKLLSAMEILRYGRFSEKKKWKEKMFYYYCAWQSDLLLTFKMISMTKLREGLTELSTLKVLRWQN